MDSSLRNAFVSVVGLSLAAATVVTLRQDTSYRVDLESVREIWSDVVHDVDKIGLGLTRIPTSEEIEIGDTIHASMSILPGHPDAAYVQAVGRSIAQHAGRHDIPYRFHVLDSRQINAFAIPGGHVYITEPMLDLIETEAELASVLGHEVAHTDLRHTIERMQYEIHLRRVVGPLSNVFGAVYWLFSVSYAHQQESEADRSGLLLMTEAGYDPAAAVGLQERFRDRLTRRAAAAGKPSDPLSEAATALDKLLENYARSHPDWPDRIDQFRTLIAQNESAWRETSFCVGRLNYERRTPCAETRFPGETRSVDQVLAELAAHAPAQPLAGTEQPGSPQDSATRPSPPVRTADSAAEAMDWGRGALSAGRKDHALAYFEQALAMSLHAAQALPPGDGSEEANRRGANLREALLADFDLSRELNRQITWQVPSELVNYPAYDEREICRLALVPYWRRWEERESFLPAVAEAQRRGLEPGDCWSMLYPL